MGHLAKDPEPGPVVPGPVAPGPVPLTGVVKVPGQAPPGWSAGHLHAAAFPPQDRPYALLEGWDFGPLFEPFSIEGEAGEHVIPWDDRFPDGPFLLEAAHRGEGMFSLIPQTERGATIPDLYFSNGLQDFRGSTVPERRHPQLKLSARNPWILRIKPVASARRLTGTMTGYGHEALLYTGPAVELRVLFRGRDTGRSGHCALWCHEVAGETRLTKERRRLLVNDTGRKVRSTVRLPAGPLLLRWKAEGDWTLTVGTP
ncbi:hypothetical protein OG357_26915 [Streptomyces sp. NBC_01255]|uniref:hypothetical protein n=1 Tax=Streptomyces sp. NBC_01255 TaxID=2903798 RepID=UPI002E30183B|nr:hypothetical protein [Streptomyces sp. NBC_01255]